MIYISLSESETFAFSFALGKNTKKGAVICLFGEPGAGKTTFTKGFTAGASSFPPDKVSSPTFNYLHIYEGTVPIYHFDLYRLNNSEEFISAGFDEYLYSNGICCIEWSEKIEDLIPPDAIRIVLSHVDASSRKIAVNE